MLSKSTLRVGAVAALAVGASAIPAAALASSPALSGAPQAEAVSAPASVHAKADPAALGLARIVAAQVGRKLPAGAATSARWAPVLSAGSLGAKQAHAALACTPSSGSAAACKRSLLQFMVATLNRMNVNVHNERAAVARLGRAADGPSGLLVDCLPGAGFNLTYCVNDIVALVRQLLNGLGVALPLSPPHLGVFNL